MIMIIVASNWECLLKEGRENEMRLQFVISENDNGYFFTLNSSPLFFTPYLPVV